METSGPPGVSNQKPTVSQWDGEEKLRATLSICFQMLNRKSIKTTELPVWVFNMRVPIDTRFTAELYLNELCFLSGHLGNACVIVCFIARVNEIANHFLL